MPALDKNGKEIVVGRFVLNNANRCFVVEGLDEYEGTTIVLTRPFKEEYLFPVGLQWSHHPEKEQIFFFKRTSQNDCGSFILI